MSDRKTQMPHDHLQKIRAILQDEFLASRMNNTKWREVATVLTGLPLSYHVKFVDDPDVYLMTHFWSGSPAWLDSPSPGPFLAVAIEWLDIDPIQRVDRGRLVAPKMVNHAAEVVRRLQSVQIPYEQRESGIRIVGHVRKI